ncbi:MAG: hypothetical protein U1C56_01910, partial [Candidatus Curtissbacteria bacterium]|nr:hypothetical protein [Candidatus Curtissbacteria bacterium]
MNLNPFSKPDTKQAQLTAKEQQWAQTLSQGTVSVKDIIAPPAIEVDFDFLKVGSTYYRTLF